MARDLSPQEKEVLRLIGAGRTTEDIARRLGIAESTVVWYVSRAVTRYGPRQTERIAVSLARAPRRRALALVLATLVALVLSGAVLASTGALGRVPMLEPLAPRGSPSPWRATPTPGSDRLPDAPATRDGPVPPSASGVPSASPAPSAPAPPLPTTAPLTAPAVRPTAPLPIATPQRLPTIALPTVPLPSAPLATPRIPGVP